eukprot:scaffold60591_cov63-Phaeocystis_antarctica.AAC.2
MAPVLKAMQARPIWRASQSTCANWPRRLAEAGGRPELVPALAGRAHHRAYTTGRTHHRAMAPSTPTPGTSTRGAAAQGSASSSQNGRSLSREQTCLGPYPLARRSGFEPCVAYSCQLQYHEKRSEGRPSRAASPSPRYMPSQYSFVPYLPPQTTAVHRDAAVAAVPSQVTGAAARSHICDDDERVARTSSNLAVASTARGGEKTGNRLTCAAICNSRPWPSRPSLLPVGLDFTVAHEPKLGRQKRARPTTTRARRRTRPSMQPSKRQSLLSIDTVFRHGRCSLPIRTPVLRLLHQLASDRDTRPSHLRRP